MSYFLGIDVGTSGTKTILIDVEGRVIGEADSAHEHSVPRPMWSEQNPEDWWNAVVNSVNSVMKKNRISPESVQAIGLSGQMHGSVFLDRNQKIIRPAILWNDQRTAAECLEIEEAAGGRKNLIKMVANPAMTGFTAPKILWLRNHEKKNFSRVATILLPKDEIRRRLTGELYTDASDASGTLLLDVRKRNWSEALLTKLNLDRDWFPRVVESEDVTGTLTTTAAKALGLTTNCKVVGGAGDCAAGAIGTGVVKEGVLSSSIGTSGVVFAHSTDYRPDPNGRLHTFCHAVRGAWHQMGVVLSAGGAMQWFRDSLCHDLRIPQGTSVYKLLDREAAATPAGAEGLYFLPYLTGERTPHADPHARGCWIGLTLAHKRGHLARSIMEGVTMAMRDSVEIIRELKVPIREIRTTGGGAASELWRQMQADVFGCRISTVNTAQGASLGVALLAAVGAGEYRDIIEATSAVVKPLHTSRPQTATQKLYASRYDQFKKLYRSLKKDFVSMGAIE